MQTVSPLFTRHSCNPLALFDAEIEKYCPENYVDIKVSCFQEFP